MFQLYIAIAYLISHICWAFPEQGIWSFNIDNTNDFVAVSKVVYKDTGVFIRVNCDAPPDKSTIVNISYDVWMLPCYEKRFQFDNQALIAMKAAHSKPDLFPLNDTPESTSFFIMESPKYQKTCGGHNTFVLESINFPKFIRYPPMPIKIIDETLSNKTVKHNSTENEKSTSSSTTVLATNSKQKREVASIVKEKTETPASKSTTTTTSHPPIHAAFEQPQVVLTNEGVYIVTVLVAYIDGNLQFNGTVDLKILGPDGYLSAVDWPLLPFYGTMCVVYVIYGLVWLLVSACQWRDLLRIQFWIGGVIFLGMLEKAVYYAEYQSINSTGKSVQGAVISAEIVSCLKRTLARMLVIIVSLGFGIVKPRLGPLLHRVVGVGGLYFLLSMFEGFMRVHVMRGDRQLLLATIFLAVLDSFICWWIFTSLVQTTRTLRLRRNIVKLSLYRHFTNTLIFAVIASIAFMVWSLRTHQGIRCVEAWKELWVDEAYWRFLFSVILLVIMILWRPTNNNQRYAFTPLLDSADEEEDDPVVPDSFEGMKMRGMKNQNHHSPRGVEDDLKWIDENIPSAISDVALPSLLDSDEEIMTTKFEMSKMN